MLKERGVDLIAAESPSSFLDDTPTANAEQRRFGLGRLGGPAQAMAGRNSGLRLGRFLRQGCVNRFSAIVRMGRLNPGPEVLKEPRSVDHVGRGFSLTETGRSFCQAE